jgi:transposase-like protein
VTLWQTNRKLTPAEVREARSLCSDHSYAELARQLGVHRSTVRAAVIGKSWNTPRSESGEPSGAKLTSSEVVEIRGRSRSEPVASLAASYGVSFSAVWRIASGRSWRELPEGLP